MSTDSLARLAVLSNIASTQGAQLVQQWLPPRLRPLLGSDLSAIQEADIRHLLGMGEATDLDFKREHYGTSDGQKKELALDVASFANAGGGLIVIGIEEDGAGTATEIVGVPDDETDHDLRVRQVIAARVAPPMPLEIARVNTADRFVWLISVPGSLRAPHAVAVGDSLRYVTRDGPGKRILSESEVADRYARRFTEAGARARHLDDLVDEGVRRAEQLRQDWCWLALALVPDVPGRIELRRGITQEWSDWVEPALSEFPALDRGDMEVAPGFRCLDLFDGGQNRNILVHGGRLDVDGAGLLLLGQYDYRQSISFDEDKPNIVDDQYMFGDLINGLGVLARHAVLCGASGDAQVAARLVSRGRSVVIVEHRSQFKGQLSGTHAVEADDLATSRHTVTLDGCATPGVDLVGAARLFATDLGSAFGLPEPQQLTRGLALAQNRFARHSHDALKQWAESAGVEVLPKWED